MSRFARLAGWVVVAVTLVAALLKFGYDALGFKSWHWHQRLVLEVQTPSGSLAGGSVVRVDAATTPKWLPGEGAGGFGTMTTGEATFVEVAPGRYLFALLGHESERALKLFFPEPRPGRFERAERLETLRDKRDVPPKLYPLLVTFTDIDDPTTVRRVDPDDLAASFGPGVALKRITLEITDEPATEGEVVEVLGWLRSGKAGIPLNKDLPYAHPMRHIPKSAFWRK